MQKITSLGTCRACILHACRHYQRCAPFSSQQHAVPLHAAAISRPWTQLRTRGRTVCSAAPKGRQESWSQAVPEGVQKYWESVLERVDRPNARHLLLDLDLSKPLGVRRTKKGSTPPMYEFFMETKAQHPTAVLLVRCGDFYESVGTDAVILVQFAGLNAMGSKSPPRAGCPKQNIRKVLSDLVNEAGLTVVVCEESSNDYSYGSKKARKERYVAQVMTPASPHYLHGLIDSQQDLQFGAPLPLLGIAAQVGGYTVLEAREDLMSCHVTEGLTEDAVTARLHEGGLASPLFLHASIHEPGTSSSLSESTPEKEWQARVSQIFRDQVGAVQKFSEPNVVEGFLQRVCAAVGKPAGAPFTVSMVTAEDRPKPLYHSTACQLGLHATRGVPSLLDALLPGGTSTVRRRWLRQLLLLPPPPAVASAIHSVCALLSELGTAVPMYPVLPTNNIVLKLRHQEASDGFFRELRLVLAAVLATLESRALGQLAAHLMAPTNHETGLHLTPKRLASDCRAAIEQIDSVIHDAELLQPAIDCSADELDLLEDSGEDTSEGTEIVRLLFTASESFRRRVNVHHIQAAYEQVEAAGSRLEMALDNAWDVVRIPRQPQSPKMRAKLIFDKVNKAVWIVLPDKSEGQVRYRQAKEGKDQTADSAFELLIHPHDRNGKLVENRYTTAELESALDEYRGCCAAASDAVRHQLRLLAHQLTEAKMPSLVSAASFAIIAGTLDLHVNEARRRQWCLPQQIGFDRARGKDDESSPLQVSGMWPYWMGGKGAAPGTVPNSIVDMSGLYLLTGPNMAGKSTVLRMTCAVALLGASGLLAPAASASIPYIDAFMLRNFSADSPIEGRSSFMVEMLEMRYVLADATQHSLVLLDELGKGTEVSAGAAIAGALVEALDRVACKGIFATHLHQLLGADLATRRLEYWCMETRRAEGGQLLPTMRMVPGTCTDSLALEVAAQSGLPPHVLHRAHQLYQGFTEEIKQLADPQVCRSDSSQCSASDNASSTFQRAASGLGAAEGPSPEEAKAQVQADMARAAAVLAACAGRLLGEEPPIAVHEVCPRQQPPAAAVGRSAVYILRRRDGFMYCGQSDDLRGRLLRHQTAAPVKGGRTMHAIYVMLPDSAAGQSAARALETATIQHLMLNGFPLITTTDARNLRTPIASAASS